MEFPKICEAPMQRRLMHRFPTKIELHPCGARAEQFWPRGWLRDYPEEMRRTRMRTKQTNNRVVAISVRSDWRSVIKLEASLARVHEARQALTSSNQSWEGKLDEANPMIVPKLAAVTKADWRMSGRTLASPTPSTHPAFPRRDQWMKPANPTPSA
jgi:hypothetical protein